MVFESLVDYIVGLIGNLGVSYADYLLILCLFGSALFTATEMRFGLYIMFILQGVLLSIFVLWDLPTIKVLILALILVVGMTLSLIYKPSQSYGGSF